jgi:LPS sulfotransferase NodH/SAM-dependent methyltransferase
MSQPFIIWTMQRTGGTSLTELLMEMSEHKSADHEPFNRDRQFGAVTIAWSCSKDEKALRRALADILAQRYLIKHTYELRDMALNLALMEEAAHSYRHVFLYRRDELARLVSKFVAQATGTWFKDYASKVYDRIREGERKLKPLPVAQLVGAYRRARAMTEAIRAAFDDLELKTFDVAYEEIYQGEPGPRRARLAELFEFLGFSAEAIESHRASIEAKIFGEGQNTRAIAPQIPNLAQAIRAVREAGYEPPPGGLGSGPLLEAAVAEAEAEEPWHRAFVGGLWDEIGELQFEFLKAQGLEPRHHLLDIGCGSLRAGVKLVPYLEPGRYFGIDARKKLLDAGYQEELLPAGLGERLPRANLCCSQSFEHGGLPDNAIDFGICAAVFTRLPLEQLGLMLRRTAKYFRPGARLYVSFHEAQDGAAKRWRYSKEEMAAAAEGTRWHARYVGEWGHPRGQKMMEYERSAT